MCVSLCVVLRKSARRVLQQDLEVLYTKSKPRQSYNLLNPGSLSRLQPSTSFKINRRGEYANTYLTNVHVGIYTKLHVHVVVVVSFRMVPSTSRPLVNNF